MAKVPSYAISTLTVTLHRHGLPLCTEKTHDRSCRRFKREGGCVAIRLDKRTVIADCFHFAIR